MRILPLCFLILLCGCTDRPNAKMSETLFTVQSWPEPVNIEKQSGVAKYVTKGKAAYDSCTANVDALRKITYPNVK